MEPSKVHIPIDDVNKIVRQYADIHKASDLRRTTETKAIEVFNRVIYPLIKHRSDNGLQTFTWEVDKDVVDVYMVREIIKYSHKLCGFTVHPMYNSDGRQEDVCDRLCFWLCCCCWCLPNSCCDHEIMPKFLNFSWS